MQIHLMVKQKTHVDYGQKTAYYDIITQNTKGNKMTKKITDGSFKQDVLQASTPVLVDFWADWCGPCKMIAPILEEISTDLGDKFTITKLNIDENPMIATEFGIRSIPTMMIFKDGKMVDSRVGALRKSDLQAWINQHIA